MDDKILDKLNKYIDGSMSEEEQEKFLLSWYYNDKTNNHKNLAICLVLCTISMIMLYLIKYIM